jgi:hypothetical protein
VVALEIATDLVQGSTANTAIVARFMVEIVFAVAIKHALYSDELMANWVGSTAGGRDISSNETQDQLPRAHCL